MRGSDVYFGDVDRERHGQASPAPGSVPFRWPSSVCAPRALQIGFYVGSLEACVAARFGQKMRGTHPPAATKANGAPVAAFPEAACASGGQGEEGLCLPSAQRGVHPGGSNRPQTISTKSLPGWRLCPAHCLFALGTTQGHILA